MITSRGPKQYLDYEKAPHCWRNMGVIQDEEAWWNHLLVEAGEQGLCEACPGDDISVLYVLPSKQQAPTSNFICVLS